MRRPRGSRFTRKVLRKAIGRKGAAGLSARLRSRKLRVAPLRVAGLGQLVPIKTIVDRLAKLEKEGKLLPGDKWLSDYRAWEDQIRNKEIDAKTPPPGELTEEEKKAFQTEYVGKLTVDLQSYVPYIYQTAFAGKGAGPSPEVAAKLLFQYGCRRLGRLLPGFTRIVRKRLSPEIDTVGDWNAEIDPSALEKPEKKKPTSGPPPYQPPKKPEIIEVCLVTHKQLEETLTRDLEKLARAARPGGQDPSTDQIHPMSDTGKGGEKGAKREFLFTDLGKYDKDLEGERFHDIAKRLLSFYRKAAGARNFARAHAVVQDKVNDLAGKLKNTPAAKTKDAKNEIGYQTGKKTVDTRTRREVLRRKVDQWTQGYEYEQLSGAFSGKLKPAKADYRKAEKGVLNAFWNDCEEIQPLCQEPKTERERGACMRCAKRVVREYCIDGSSKGKCGGGHSALVRYGR